MAVVELELVALNVGTATALVAMMAVLMERDRIVGIWFRKRL
jgi:hypothetical protein